MEGDRASKEAFKVGYIYGPGATGDAKRRGITSNFEASLIGYRTNVGGLVLGVTATGRTGHIDM